MPPPRRLLLVTQHFAPHFEGGTESVVRAQARELAALGFEVGVLSGTDRPHAGSDVEEAEVDGLPVAFVPRTPAEPYDLELERPRLAALVGRRLARADLVHVHHWSTLSCSLVRAAAAAGARTAVTLHDLFTTCPRFFRVPVPPVERCPEGAELEPCARCVSVDAPGVALAELRAGLAARRAAFTAELAAADLLLAPSRSHAARVTELLGLAPGRVRVVGHGLCAPLGPSDASHPWDGTGPLRVLHPGHRAEVKGTLDLVRALALLPAAERRRVELLLLGAEVEPGFDDALRTAAGDLPLVFGGSYDLASLARRYAELGGAHLAALPSRVEESYGLVVDEAMALGIPVWVSDRGAPRERVGGAGRVLPAAEPEAWTRAFRALLAEPALLAAERDALPREARTAADAARELAGLYADAGSPA